MKPMETVQDLIEEAKLRTVWWALLIFAVSYFLTHTSKSMWMNIPIAILLVSALRILSNEVEFRWKDRKEERPRTYLSHLEKKQLSLDDPRLSTPRPPPVRWKKKIDSPVVEAAIDDFIGKIMQDFVVDLWYSEITPDREAPELIRAVIMDALSEIAGRVRALNLMDLLTRDVIDIIGDHIDLFRRNQAAIGVDVMGTLSSEERDERLKHHLMASKELHPALVSPECEYKVLQQLIGGVIAVVLRPREAQCPLVRCISRELVTCLVLQPIMDFACPAFINELIEYIILSFNEFGTHDSSSNPTQASDHRHGHSVPGCSMQDSESTTKRVPQTDNLETVITLARFDGSMEISQGFMASHKEIKQSPPAADWARVMEAATQRRTEILAPENLENMWTKGRNYKRKVQKIADTLNPSSTAKDSEVKYTRDLGKETVNNSPGISKEKGHKALSISTPQLVPDSPLDVQNKAGFSRDSRKQKFSEEKNLVTKLNEHTFTGSENKSRLKRSNSTSDLKADDSGHISKMGGLVISEDFYSPNFVRPDEENRAKNSSEIVPYTEGSHFPKLRCRVVGAYFEKIGSKSFAVYSIAVTDAENASWFVKRRYRNFERLHRHLKDIPNYTLHLPPKRIFSSSTEDAFVHQRCIQLDKYLQDLLSIANVAEQHEVWDFLSLSSKNYSFGKSPSVMRTLAVNVDDAVDDIVRQFKGVSDGLMRKVVGPSSSPYDDTYTLSSASTWHSDEVNKLVLRQSTASINSFSDNEEGDKDGNHEQREESIAQSTGWHSDNELNSKSFPPRVVKREDFRNCNSEKKRKVVTSELIHSDAFFSEHLPVTSDNFDDSMGMPPEWTPPNVSVPILNLVDKIFQLKRRGWLRRQVFWISKQILQLMMEDAIDDWLLGQVHWIRREDVIAQGIRWVQDMLWPDGKFFKQLSVTKSTIGNNEVQQRPVQTISLGGPSTSGAFEQQLEAARRASDVKKMLFEGAPTTLVSLIGSKQYKRCAKDIYYFLQSTTCVKQLSYGVLELLLISVFPELRDLVVDVHKQMRGKSV